MKGLSQSMENHPLGRGYKEEELFATIALFFSRALPKSFMFSGETSRGITYKGRSSPSTLFWGGVFKPEMEGKVCFTAADREGQSERGGRPRRRRESGREEGRFLSMEDLAP